VIGFPEFTTSAEATAVSGALAGGGIMPLVFPVNIVDCDTSGDLGTGEVSWQMSNKDGPDADLNPEGQEYIVPLCKTGEGSFMVLDLDGTMNNCEDEVTNPPAKQFRQQLRQADGRRDERVGRQGRADPDLRRRLHDSRWLTCDLPHHPGRGVLRGLHVRIEQWQ
jgi:hypothetical protein